VSTGLRALRPKRHIETYRKWHAPSLSARVPPNGGLPHVARQLWLWDALDDCTKTSLVSGISREETLESMPNMPGFVLKLFRGNAKR